MVTLFFSTRSHWYPAIPFSDSASHQYLIILFKRCFTKDFLHVINSFINIHKGCDLWVFKNPTVRLNIARNIVGTWWSNVSMYGKLFFTRFLLVAARLLSCIIRIYDYSPSSALSPSSISYKRINGSIPKYLSPVKGLPLCLSIEDFTVFIRTLMVLAILWLLKFSTQVNFKSN